MSQQLQAFLDVWSPTQISTGRDMHSGDPSSWIQAWSHQEPVSVFGAGVRGRSGWDAVLRTITWVASRFEDCSDYEYELIAADVHGDLAYTCGFERYTATRPNGGRLSSKSRSRRFQRQRKSYAAVGLQFPP